MDQLRIIIVVITLLFLCIIAIYLIRWLIGVNKIIETQKEHGHLLETIAEHLKIKQPDTDIPSDTTEITEVHQFCPACHHPITGVDKACPDCGISLK